MLKLFLTKISLTDVDTPEPDEKSIITYVSQLYDVFPEPPAGHPLFDVEAQKRLQQFRDLASSLHQWIKEQIVIMQVCVLRLVLFTFIFNSISWWIGSV